MKNHTCISKIIVILSINLVMVTFGYCESAENYILSHGYMDSLFNTLTKKDAKIAMEIWLNEIKNQSNKFRFATAKTTIFYDLPSLIAAVRAKKVDFVGMPSLDYFLVKDKIPIEPLLTYTVGGHPGTDYYLVVSKDKESTSLNWLKNKRLLIQKHDEFGQIPLLWLNSLLKKRGLPPADVFFSSIKLVETPSQAILPVFFKKADCCIVAEEGFMTSRELNPQIGESLAIAAKSPSLTIGLFAVRKDLAESIKKEVTEIGENLSSYPKGKQILTLFKVGGFRHAKPSDLDSVLELINDNKINIKNK